jgi:hypothetical protein
MTGSAPLPRLRQVGVVTRDPAPVERAVQEALGLALSDRYPGVDGFGLGTAFFPLGNQFFEVVHAAVRGTSADRLIERRGGDTGFVAMLETGELASVRERVDALGVRVVDRGEGPEGDWIQIHPHDIGGTLVAVHQMHGEGAGDDDGPWLYGGSHWRDARRTERVSQITAATWACRDPAAVAVRWRAMLGIDAGPGDDSVQVHEVALRDTTLRFASASASLSASASGTHDPGLVAMTVRCTDREAVLADAARLGVLGPSGTVRLGGLAITLG